MDKYTKIPNEILEALARTKLTAYESKYIHALLRKTFGWNKLSDYIANSQFAQLTGMRRPHVCRTQKHLIKRGIVTQRGNKLSINKSFDQWKELPHRVTVTPLGNSVTPLGNKKLPRLVATKNSKDTIQSTTVSASLVSYWLIKTNELKGYKPLSDKKDIAKAKEFLSTYCLEEGEDFVDWYLSSEHSTKFGAFRTMFQPWLINNWLATKSNQKNDYADF
jgi:phage replication O-like protein O